MFCFRYCGSGPDFVCFVLCCLFVCFLIGTVAMGLVLFVVLCCLFFNRYCGNGSGFVCCFMLFVCFLIGTVAMGLVLFVVLCFCIFLCCCF